MSSEYNSDCELKRFIAKLFTIFSDGERPTFSGFFSLYKNRKK